MAETMTKKNANSDDLRRRKPLLRPQWSINGESYGASRKKRLDEIKSSPPKFHSVEWYKKVDENDKSFFEMMEDIQYSLNHNFVYWLDSSELSSEIKELFKNDVFRNLFVSLMGKDSLEIPIPRGIGYSDSEILLKKNIYYYSRNHKLYLT